MTPIQALLTLNAGSSSLKFAVFGTDDQAARLAFGAVERIGLDGSVLRVFGDVGQGLVSHSVPIPTHQRALELVLEQIDAMAADFELVAVGHRVAQGGPDCDCSERITPALMAQLRGLVHLAPLHLAANIAGIEAVEAARPELAQIACYDTAFHHGLPPVAQMTGLPRRFSTPEIRRYGYHGLSYEYIFSSLRADGVDVEAERIVILHLGNGASICAIAGGQSVETTMGFSTASGLPMGTRSGDLDPGLIDYLQVQGRIDAKELAGFLYKGSGLKGLSGISRNMADLLASQDPAAAEAIAYYCYHARRHLVGLTASISGVDRIVFTGGIGANAPQVRAAICEGLGYLGVDLDRDRNQSGSIKISSDNARVTVEARVTDEEEMIARHVREHVPCVSPKQQEAC